MLLRELKPLIPELKETRLKVKSAGSSSEKHENAAHKPASGAGKRCGLRTERHPEQTPDTDKSQAAVSVPSARTATESGDVMIPLKSVEQVRALVGDVFREALSENNTVLKKDISSTVTTDVMHEMDFSPSG